MFFYVQHVWHHITSPIATTAMSSRWCLEIRSHTSAANWPGQLGIIAWASATSARQTFSSARTKCVLCRRTSAAIPASVRTRQRSGYGSARLKAKRPWDFSYLKFWTGRKNKRWFDLYLEFINIQLGEPNFLLGGYLICFFFFLNIFFCFSGFLASWLLGFLAFLASVAFGFCGFCGFLAS